MAGRRTFGRIRKRSSGRFQAGYVGPDTATHYAPVTFTAEVDAEGWLRDERRIIESGDWTPPADREQARHGATDTFEDYAEKWLKRRSLKESTRANYRQLLDSRLLPEFGDAPLRSISQLRIEQWLAAEGQATPTATANAYALLRSIFNGAVKDKQVPVSPCQVERAGRKKRRKRIEPASLAELEIIVTEMKPERRLAVLLAAWCALRFGEITELRRYDIDLKNRRIKVRRGVVTVDGERIVDSPKSEAGVRDVAIPPHLLPAIEQHLRDYAQPGRTGLLFYGKDGRQLAETTMMGKKARRRRVKGRMVKESATGYAKACAAAGRPDLSFHDLRHTGAVLAAQAGATIAELMNRLGHSTPAAAMIYQHAARDRDAEIARRLSEMAGGQSDT